MTIKSNIYEVCKEIKGHESRVKIRDLIRDLEPEPPTEEGHYEADDLAYLARQEYSQIFGYLLIDQKREEIEKNHPFPLRIKPLMEDDKKFLTAVHLSFQKINNCCIDEAFSKLLPKCTKSVNPYSHYPDIEFLESSDIGIVSNESINSIASLFIEHPSVQIAMESKKMFPKEMKQDTEADYLNSVNIMFQELYKAGAFDQPLWMKNIFRSLPPEAPHRVIARHFISLACFKSSLRVMNQILYQAILYDKLPLLSEDNIISVKKINADTSAISLDCQLQDLDHFLEPSEVVLVKFAAKYDDVNQLCQIIGEQINAATSFGDRLLLDMRGIDDNLNPFKSILEII